MTKHKKPSPEAADKHCATKHAKCHTKRRSNKRRLALHGLFLGAAAIGAAIGFSGVPEKATAVTDSWPGTLQYSTGMTGNYLSGRFAANHGDFSNANKYLTQTLHQDPKNLEIAGYTYRMHLITGDMNGAEELAKELYKAKDPESNPEIMMLLSEVKHGNYKKARQVLATFDKNGFNEIIIPLIEAWFQYGEGTLKKPVQLDKMLAGVNEFAPFVYYQTALINDIAGFDKVALAQYEKVLETSKAMPYRVVQVLGNLYARRGEWDKMKALYTQYQTQNPESVLLVPPIEEMAKKNERPERLVTNVKEGMAEIFFSTASILQNENLNEEALIYVQQVLYLSPEFTAAQLMRGTILEQLGRNDEALAVYQEIPSYSPYYFKAKLRMAYTLNALKRTDESLDLLKGLAQTLSQEHQIYLTHGDILMREKQYGGAVTAYSQAIEKMGKEEAQHWPVYYARGISAERSGNWPQAEKDFLKALELEPDQPDVMNYLGYSWLTQNIRTDEARNMIAKAMEVRPTDAHIIDSMGWALYLSKQYAESVDYLERAIELMPVDPTVNDHLGDVYWRMGRQNEARFQWQRAKLFSTEEAQLLQLTDKLANGLPAVDDLRSAKNEHAAKDGVAVR